MRLIKVHQAILDVSLPAVIPSNMKVVAVGAKTFLQKKTRRRRRFKLPAKTRQKMAASARRIKIPILTLVAVGIPIITAAGGAGGLTNALSSQKGFIKFGSQLLMKFTGINPQQPQTGFQFKQFMQGGGPLIALAILRRSGVFKGVNQQLGRARLPLRLT